MDDMLRVHLFERASIGNCMNRLPVVMHMPCELLMRRLTDGSMENAMYVRKKVTILDMACEYGWWARGEAVRLTCRMRLI